MARGVRVIMGGLFGIVSRHDCALDLFYGTDYHSHLGTKRGGLVTKNSGGFKRYIHDITNAQFRSKFHDDVEKLHGNVGIGVISDLDDQPLIIGSHLGVYAIATVGKINNLDELVDEAFNHGWTHFSEMSGEQVNPTEMMAVLINQGTTIEDGIQKAQDMIDGSCTLLLLAENGLYAARDKFGRTPLILGEKPGSFAVTMETTAFPNLGYEATRDLGPGEIAFLSVPGGVERRKPPNGRMKICSFLWVYYGYPASSYEGINVEVVRQRCGACLARDDAEQGSLPIDLVTGIPDSGTAHGLGYANEAGLPFSRPFVKYTPTWPRSFMPQDQEQRNLVARMKLLAIKDLIKGKRLLFCEDSIVRGTQLRDTIQQLHDLGAREVHMRAACPPLLYGCKYLNFSRSKSELDLAGRWAIQEMNGDAPVDVATYKDPYSAPYQQMVEHIRQRLHLTSLRYQRLDRLVRAIGLPKEQLCTYCWDGEE